MNLSNDIRICRERKHWTQADLAARLGVSQVAVSRWEGGHESPRKRRYLLAEVLDLDPETLRCRGSRTPSDEAGDQPGGPGEGGAISGAPRA